MNGLRMASHSTRTTHPYYIGALQEVFSAVGLKVNLLNPYHFKTKGEMLRECLNQDMLRAHAFQTTSCGRFKQFGYNHCGRCVPCMVRRAAFHAWSDQDATNYVYANLARDDDEHAGFDDVRSVLIGIAARSEIGTLRWLGSTLSSGLVTDKQRLADTVERGMAEVEALMISMGVT